MIETVDGFENSLLGSQNYDLLSYNPNVPNRYS